MLIGIPKEVKNHEYRVALTPFGVSELINAGNKVLIQKSAGLGIGFTDADYLAVGATIVNNSEDIWEDAKMVVKVKEPQENECGYIKKNQVVFSYLHLASAGSLTENLLKSACAAIAFETVTDDNGQLPLLLPMSEVAGRISIQIGARYLEKTSGGLGVLLCGATGVEPAKVVVIGGGIAGLNAAMVASGAGADVIIIEKNINRIRYLNTILPKNVKVLYSNNQNIENSVKIADLVIGAVLIPGATAPKLVTKQMVSKMKKGSVIVDIAIDQGGCCETSRPTTHSDPVYEVDGVIHYCVTNMPGCVAKTASLALENAILPYVLEIASKNGYIKHNKHLVNGLNTYHGNVTNQPVADSMGLQFVDPYSVM